jgi:hypothetical protein
MEHRERKRHPRVMRFMQVDSELAGILIACGFVLMGLVSLPIAKWFFMGALSLGVLIALFFRLMRKDKPPQSLGLSRPLKTLETDSAEPPKSAPSLAQRNPRLSVLPA